MQISDPTSGATPVGADFYFIGERGGEEGGQFGPFGELIPLQKYNQTGRGYYRCTNHKESAPAASRRKLLKMQKMLDVLLWWEGGMHISRRMLNWMHAMKIRSDSLPCSSFSPSIQQSDIWCVCKRSLSGEYALLVRLTISLWHLCLAQNPHPNPFCIKVESYLSWAAMSQILSFSIPLCLYHKETSQVVVLTCSN